MNNLSLLISILLGIAIIQGLFLVFILLFLKKGNKKANYIGIALILTITLIIFQNFLGFSGYYKLFPHFIFLFYPLNGILGPLFFFYIVTLIEPARKFKWGDLFHVIVFLLLLLQHREFIFSSASVKIQVADYVYNADSQQSIKDLIKFFFIKAYTLSYPLAAAYLVRKKIAHVKNYSSNTSIGYLTWLSSFSFAFAVFTGLVMIVSVINYFFHGGINMLEIWIHLINALFIHFMVFMAVRQPEKLWFVFESNGFINKESRPKWPMEKLLDLMELERPYLNPELKIHDVAAMLDVPPYSLSAQINKQLGTNFYEFINQYRVEEFKKRAISDKYNHLTLLAIAYDVGFNSKASFNRIFKKHTGHTPSRYLNLERSTNF